MKIVVLLVCFAISETTSARLERSYGGIPTSILRASYFVSIKKNDLYKCGGALITKRHVLTVAICVVDIWDRLDYENEVVIASGTKCVGGFKHRIELITLVEGYADRQYDLAVLVIPSHAARSPLIIPLTIGQPSFYAVANLFSFGSAENPLTNTLLHKLSVIPWPNDESGEIHDVAWQVYPRTFLALGGVDHVRQEDTGGPLVQNETLVGITSSLRSGADSGPVFIWVYKFGERLQQLVPDMNILP